MLELLRQEAHVVRVIDVVERPKSIIFLDVTDGSVDFVHFLLNSVVSLSGRKPRPYITLLHGSEVAEPFVADSVGIILRRDSLVNWMLLESFYFFLANCFEID